MLQRYSLAKPNAKPAETLPEFQYLLMLQI